MANLAQLEAVSRDFSAAIESLTAYYRNERIDSPNAPGARLPQLIPTGAVSEAHRAKESVLASLTKLQVMLAGPTDLLQNLAWQTQLLACIQWLGDFQVPACIPLEGRAMIKDVSNLIGVPESQLCRVIRMATTGGYMQEPQPGYVSHSELSAAFVAKPSYLDAAMFLAETGVPAALDMATATKQYSDSAERNDGVPSYSLFATASEAQLPRLHRQRQAYLRYGTGHVGAQSTERVITLANQYPSLHFTVQLQSDKYDKCRTPNPRITISHRQPGSPQPILNAAVYILNFPFPAPGSPCTSFATQVTAELRAHLPALKLNRSATLVLTAPSLSDSAEGVTLTRIHNLSLQQLAMQPQLGKSEVLDLLNGVNDGEGRLALVNQVRSVGKYGVVALEVKYQPHAFVG
ncbi:hypothetical protein N7489_005116 [Penicillium chrysogenum]|uniref:uncharacterized protein n=1 Tax=Penicillium chrysogenum TaxID=5076 RepID=UPI0024DF216F|nr:uncharacterized protein N7489_005116 [Penicillium chrysogenum]KAJ5245020.1 hypothetical protein N7489_005116 [Penicillium chrysogenum]